jgi:hypothetical protein
MGGNEWRWERQLHGIIPPLISIAVLLDEAGLGAVAGAPGER